MVHRVTHLLIHRLKLDALFVSLILGPFAQWVDSADRIACEMSSDDQEEAHHIISSCGVASVGVDEIKIHAALRMARLYRVWLENKHNLDGASNASQYIGMLMDLHMPVLMHDGVLQMHEVYSLGIAPEQVKLSSVYSDVHYPMSMGMIEEIWHGYISNSMQERREAVPSKRALSRQRKRKRRVNGFRLFPEVQEAHVAHFTIPQDKRSFIKIAHKGMPRSASFRSIKTLFCKAMTFDVKSNQAIVHMARLFLLGSYRHCTHIAPPSWRIRVYKSVGISAPWMVSKIQELTNKSLFALVSEYVIGMARSHPTLYYLLESDPDWASYTEQAIRVCDTVLRPSLYRGKAVQPPRIEVAFCKPVKPHHVFWALVKVLGIKDRVPRRILESASSVVPSLHSMYAIFRKQHGVPRIFGKALRDVNVNKEEVDIIARFFAQIRASNVNKILNDLVKSLRESTVSIMYLYVHLLCHQSKFSVIPTVIQRPPVDVGHKIPSILVCTSCYTMRSQAEGSTTAKSKDGTHIDTVRFDVTCSACSSPGVKHIDLRYNRVVALSPNDMILPRMFVMCRQCHCVTVYKHVIGDAELCSKCYEMAVDRLVPRRCICGVPFTTRNAVKAAFVAKDDKGMFSLFALCGAHAHIMQHYSGINHPVAFFRNLISSL